MQTLVVGRGTRWDTPKMRYALALRALPVCRWPGGVCKCAGARVYRWTQVDVPCGGRVGYAAVVACRLTFAGQ